ncbi:TetR/AcrR family transcriptional regulator [Rhodococcus spelaei]|uniref:TetR/AcrR family transcriptional regulator n=1 Tax=Rhodococcus spelaei TaxID=2546320 RepID=A0A541B1X5_9NOCA|nr:TetR/AcrR family transcriptional regulator [Rhodococcus spelaei]TQF66311.1 TetR/AcrR family transcriptional regulator [Rhodococcus spelaei]
MSSERVYAGMEGDQRRAERRAQLIEAGLDLLGDGSSGAASGHGRSEVSLSVRGVCKHAGLATRYFYENFDDRDALVVAVYDHAVERIAEGTLRAVAQAPRSEREVVRAGVAHIVRAVTEDPRLGRLVFSGPVNSVLAQRRLESARMFAGLTTAQAADFYELPAGPHVDVVAHFVVGGLAQVLTAWLDGTVDTEESDLVERCTELMIAAAGVR